MISVTLHPILQKQFSLLFFFYLADEKFYCRLWFFHLYNPCNRYNNFPVLCFIHLIRFLGCAGLSTSFVDSHIIFLCLRIFYCSLLRYRLIFPDHAIFCHRSCSTKKSCYSTTILFTYV